MNHSLENLIEETKDVIVSLMNHNGLNSISDFSIKIKELKNNHDLACYRGSTVFSSRAIFWVNENFTIIVTEHAQRSGSYLDAEETLKYIKLELWKTLIHEVGHSVADLLRFMARYENNASSKELVKKWIGFDEEDFAEDFIYFLQTNQISAQPWFPYYQSMITKIML